MGEFVSVLLPVLSIEVLDLDEFERIGVGAAEVNTDAARVGARDVEGLDAAGFTEVVLRQTGLEPLAAECVPGSQSLKYRAQNDKMQEPDTITDGAIATVQMSTGISLEPDRAAVTVI